jgi:hypothetical protein
MNKCIAKRRNCSIEIVVIGSINGDVIEAAVYSIILNYNYLY